LYEGYWKADEQEERMGEVKLLYDPKTINWQARSRVEAWERHDSDMSFDKPELKRIKFSTILGICTAGSLVLGVSIFRILG
jgi:hypothetical protein